MVLASKRLVSQFSASLPSPRILKPWSPARHSAIVVAHQCSIRTMASSTSEKKRYEWLVIAPDIPGALSKRMAVRPKHLENAKVLADDGRLVLGGATLDEQPKPGEAPKINGSALIVMAETKAEVEELVKSDVYAKETWDLDKVQIYPFVSAVRHSL